MRRTLTEAMVSRINGPRRGRLEIFDAIIPGFALRVTATGTKTYSVHARVKGQATPIRVTIGDASTMKLAEARRLASEALRAMRAGHNPQEMKKAKAEASEHERRSTFEVVAEGFIAEHVSTLRSRSHTTSEIRRYLIEPWRGRPIASITDDDIGERIREIMAEGKPHMARLVLAHAKRLFRWAASLGRTREERLKVNPALSLSATKDFDLRVAPRQGELSGDHLRVLWQAAEKLGEPFGPFFRMLLLSGQRRSEVAEMTWGELDLDGERVWNISADRMKAGRPDVLPDVQPPGGRVCW